MSLLSQGSPCPSCTERASQRASLAHTSNTGVLPPGLSWVNLVLSLSLFKSSLKLFQCALITQWQIPLLPAQAGSYSSFLQAIPCKFPSKLPHWHCLWHWSLALFMVLSKSFFTHVWALPCCPWPFPGPLSCCAMSCCGSCSFLTSLRLPWLSKPSPAPELLTSATACVCVYAHICSHKCVCKTNISKQFLCHILNYTRLG